MNLDTESLRPGCFALLEALLEVAMVSFHRFQCDLSKTLIDEKHPTSILIDTDAPEDGITLVRL